MVALMSDPPPKVAFVAWRRLSRRTTLICKAIGAELWFFPDRLPYLRAAFKTFSYVRKNRPQILLVQLPQGPLLLQALLLRSFYGCKVVADVHTGFLMQWEWKSYLLNAPFRPLLKYADHVLIHNNAMNELLSQGAQKKALVVFDPWQFIEVDGKQLKEGDYLVFPASYHPDEPLEEVLECVYNNFTQIKLYVTGDWRRRPALKRFESKNIIFTGFLAAKNYESLLAGSKAIVSGTNEEFTILMSAWEAIAHNKPLAITSSRAVSETYGDYPTYYNWRNEHSIKNAILQILNQKEAKESGELNRKTMDSIHNLRKILRIV